MKTEKIILDEKSKVTLTAYIQDVGREFANINKRPVILILPGGGYQVCSNQEADPVAAAYLKAGYHACILRYSVGENAKWPKPLEDYEKAMELIRSKEEEWHLYSDKIAVIGFSAGGHLAASAAVMSKNRPSAVILGYALTGDDVENYNYGAPDTVQYVDEKTCPCFLFAARNDEIVPVMNTIKFMEALAKFDVSFESHIYSYGPHGFSTCDSSVVNLNPRDYCRRIPQWVNDSIGWLKEIMGDFDDGCLTEPLCKAHINGNYEANLSLECTMEYIFRDPKGEEIIRENISGFAKTDVENMKEYDMFPFFKNMKASSIFRAMGVPDERLEEINSQLMKIKNMSAAGEN